MTRTCTVCSHPERQAIDKALIDTETPYRRIAARYAISGTALLRHKADHVTADILAAWQRERAENGAELADQLRGWMDRVTMLLDACHEFLEDPDRPGKYTLAPHTWEVVIHTETDMGPDQRPLRRKMKLADALILVDGKERIGDVVLVESKIADPRELVLKAVKTLEGNQRLLGELAGKLQTQGTINFLASPEWLALRTRMVAALAGYPEAKLALASAIEGEYREVAD